MAGKKGQGGIAGGRITAQDVAARAGVSIGTVSRVINSVPGVKPAIAAKVQKAIDELGWSPNLAAQTIRASSSRMIGFIFSDIRNPLYAMMTKGAEEVLSARGYLLVTASSDGQAAKEVALINLFKRRRADGMILTVEREGDAEVNQTVSRASMPYVMMERELPIGGMSVGADHYNGIRQATDYLLGLGHRRIAVITGGRGTRVARDRMRAFQDSLAARGMAPDDDLMKLDSFASEYGYRQMSVLLGMRDPPTAVLSLGVRLLPGVVSGLRNLGKSYPDDVSLICSNDTDLATMASPPITAVRYDAMALGRLAAEALLDRIGSGEALTSPLRIELATELVLRGSCRALTD
ncbi:substrate-binding domain-containing protein [Enterovirga rhinocerotis]|uniref:LacI family transcriptional regulator n=1 Tax=Enterovirga rhinocerotis TaxID=1339210 RepID=A0A4R7C9A1_9HYPH|nr:substrate-binding domain-containing protein [Enterovirga rhinocerotis]TDR93307.1 LacI family transcriptional regulator [Enterovirga rhinocerotis]